MRAKGIPGLDRDFKAWQAQPFAAELGLGWLTPIRADVIAPGEQHALGPLSSGGVKGKGQATFRLGHPNGKIGVSVPLSGAKGSGAASITANETTRDNVRIDEHSRQTVMLLHTLRVRSVGGTLDHPWGT